MPNKQCQSNEGRKTNYYHYRFNAIMWDNLQAGTPNKEPEDFDRAKSYCPYALANR